MNKKTHATVSTIDASFYKHWTEVTLRYGDTDRQGHINNSVFTTLYESGRVDFLFESHVPLSGIETNFVIAKISLDFLSEMNFPGVAKIGSSILKIGDSSITVAQAIFLNGTCCSTSESIIVLISSTSRKPIKISSQFRNKLINLTINLNNLA